MALFLGSKGNDAATLRATDELISRLRRRIATLQGTGPEEAITDLLGRLAVAWAGESALEAEFLAAHADLIAAASTADGASLPDVVSRCRRLVTEHFLRRRAPLAVHTALRTLDETVLRRVFALAPVPADAPWCWLACGWLGRGEVTFVSGIAGSYIGPAPEAFAAFAEPLLASCGYLVDNRPICGGLKCYAGLDQWQEAVAALTATGNESCSSLVDLRSIGGSPDFAASALAIARSGLSRWRQSALFSQAAREASNMRVALGFFGGLKVERSGEFRGAINIDAQALCPLALNLRFMAIAFGLSVTDTPSRLRELVRLNRLNVDPASRLMEAFQLLQRLKMESELAPDRRTGLDRHVWPDQLPPAEQEALRESLEAVSALERLVVQQLVGAI